MGLFGSKEIKKKTDQDHKDFPFWCGYLPDKDAENLLQFDGQFILRHIKDGNVFVTVAADDDNDNVQLLNLAIRRTDRGGFRLSGQPYTKETVKELIEFFWCTRFAIHLRHMSVRMEVPVLRPEWLLCSSNLTIQQQLGAGAYGEVYKAVLNDENKETTVAVKTLLDEDRADAIWQEARTMRDFHNENLVQMHGIVNDCKPFFLVIEYVDGSAVSSFLIDNKNADNRIRTRILIDAAKGMRYLHSKEPPFLHLDIAARNLLMRWKGRSDFQVKVADFGQTVRKRLQTIDPKKPTNLRWMDPDSFKNKSVDRLTDVYAFGVTFYEVFVRPYKIPYQDWDANRVHEDVIMASSEDRYVLPRPRYMSASIYELMQNCMLLDDGREERPTFDVILNVLKRIDAENDY